MGMVVKVLLNQDKAKVKNYITIVAGQQKNPYYPEERREYQCGISIFYNDKYLLNFVLNDDEVDMLKSHSRVKVIDDLSYILLAKRWSLTILKNRCMTNKDNEITERIGGLEEQQGYYQVNTYDEVQLTSHNEYAFVSGLRCAMLYPFSDFNITISIPEVNPENVVVL